MSSPRLRSLLALLAIGALAASCRDSASEIATPTGPPVSARNLLANEPYWPYRVKLVEDWPAPGLDQPIPKSFPGVVIRVEPSGNPRVDFGRLGKYEIPVGKTDLIERANQIRVGAEKKEEPNFIHALKNRMGDSAADQPRALPPEDFEPHHGFLCVFADPSAPGFDAIAAALEPLQDRSGVMTVFFPQGQHAEHADLALRDQLRGLDWKVPFVLAYLSEPYTRTLLVEGTPFPYVMLQTAEGRVLFQSEWRPDVLPKLEAAFDQAFAGGETPRG